MTELTTCILQFKVYFKYMSEHQETETEQLKYAFQDLMDLMDLAPQVMQLEINGTLKVDVALQPGECIETFVYVLQSSGDYSLKGAFTLDKEGKFVMSDIYNFKIPKHEIPDLAALIKTVEHQRRLDNASSQ